MNGVLSNDFGRFLKNFLTAKKISRVFAKAAHNKYADFYTILHKTLAVFENIVYDVLSTVERDYEKEQRR